MPQGVIYGLEAIYVQQHNCHRFLLTDGAQKFSLQERNYLCPIPKTSQEVVRGRKAQRSLCRDELIVKIQNSLASEEPGSQFLGVERLDKIIVRSRFHRENQVFLVALSR